MFVTQASGHSSATAKPFCIAWLLSTRLWLSRSALPLLPSVLNAIKMCQSHDAHASSAELLQLFEHELQRQNPFSTATWVGHSLKEVGDYTQPEKVHEGTKK